MAGFAGVGLVKSTARAYTRNVDGRNFDVAEVNPTKKPTLDAAASTKSPVASPTIPSSGNSHATSGSFGSSISLLTISLTTILWYGFAALPVL